MGKKKPLPIIENVTIDDIAGEGKAVTRIDGMVVFVPYVVPGDVVDLQVTRKKHNYCEAKAIRLHVASPMRVEPFCKHFGVCGGCKWQCLSYDKQLEYKQKLVVNSLVHIGKVQLPPVSPIIGAEKTQAYRNKIEFSFSNKRWLTEEEIAHQEVQYSQHNGVGFHITGAFDKVLDIDTCYLMDDLQNRIRNGVRAFALEHSISFFDLRQQTGVLRDMMFRTSNSGEVMLVFQFHITNDREHDEAVLVLNYVASTFPEVTSLLWTNNLKCNDTFQDLDIQSFRGPEFVYELMEDLRFKVGPKSFYQTNNDQAYNLYKVVRSFCNLTCTELVYDLYTGTGTIANFVARRARRVVGIEYVPEAIEDAKVNSAINHIENTLFFAGDMKDILNEAFINEHGRPDIIITDPPRAGMHSDVVKAILYAAPRRIVYVSCNPPTQARDVQLLDAQYRIAAVQPVDMFPHTQHIENVLLLERRDEQ